jgi:hypothetical protein
LGNSSVGATPSLPTANISLNNMKNYLDISAIEDWERATEGLKHRFVERYFGDDAEYYWIADEIGSVLYVNDRFFNLSDLVDFLKYGYTANQMFKYYDECLEARTKDLDKPFINIKNWIKLKKQKHECKKNQR